MRYPIFIEPGDHDHAFGVIVPDLPGCFSAGDTLEEALDNAREAVATWLESQLDNGEAVPASKTVDAYFKDFAGWIPSMVDIDLADVLGEAERINISLPKRVIRRLDAQAEKANTNRSAYIAKLALDTQNLSEEIAKFAKAMRADEDREPTKSTVKNFDPVGSHR